MAQFNTVFLASIFFLSLVLQQANALKCYNCTINFSGQTDYDAENCRTVGTKTKTTEVDPKMPAEACTHCVRIYDKKSDGIVRSCLSAKSIKDTKDANPNYKFPDNVCGESLDGGKMCTCIADSCNNEEAPAKKTTDAPAQSGESSTAAPAANEANKTFGQNVLIGAFVAVASIFMGKK